MNKGVKGKMRKARKIKRKYEITSINKRKVEAKFL